MGVGSFLQAASRSYNICKSRVPASDFTSRRGFTERKYALANLQLS